MARETPIAVPTHQPAWTPHDHAVLTLLEQQHAVSFDHLPQLLARCQEDQSATPLPTWKRIAQQSVERLQRAGLVRIHHVGRHDPDWVWLTKAGQQTLDLPLSRKRLTHHALAAYYAANAIRLRLAAWYPHATWKSQDQVRRESDTHGRTSSQTPTAELHLATGERISIHVTLRLTAREDQIATRMCEQLQRKTSTGAPYYSALWYYARPSVARRLRAARGHVAQALTQEMARTISVFSYPLASTTVLYRGHRAPVCTLDWSRDGQWIASASRDQILHMWDATSGDVGLERELSAVPSVLAWSPDGKWLTLGDAQGHLSVWDAVMGDQHTLLAAHSDVITGLAWSPHGDPRIASCSRFGHFHVYDLNQQTRVWEAHRHPQGIRALAWSPNGARLATGGEDGAVRLFDATTGQHQVTYKKHRASITALAWSPDSQQLASAGEDGTVQVWDAASGKKRRTFRGALGTRAVLAWSPNGTWLAGGGSDPCVQIWDITTGRPLSTYEEQADAVTCLAWSPDSSLLASGSVDGTVHVFHAAGGPR